eukprot:COSAG02_NODE_6517_length_3523_cov_13.416472_3_plen_147_part_00
MRPLSQGWGGQAATFIAPEMLPHIGGAATERTRGRKANRFDSAVEYTRMVDPTVMTDLRQAKAVSLTGLSKQQRTPRFKRFINTAPLDRFLLVRAASEILEHYSRLSQPLQSAATSACLGLSLPRFLALSSLPPGFSAVLVSRWIL